MDRWCVLLAIVFGVSGCFDAGELRSSDADVADGGDAANETGDSGTDARDAVDTEMAPCGDCPEETPICREETETCVECLGDSDCTGETPVCDPAVDSCVACLPEEESDWFPDEDGDGFGAESADRESACDQPGEMVGNAEDCDDTDEAVHPEADEICNSRDDNCNDTVDGADELVAIDCASQMGVCQGATTRRCDADGNDYASCGSDEYGEAFRTADDEAWRCDGKDNNCDGETDEACCGSDETPSSGFLSGFSNHRVNPSLVAATSGATSDAAYLVAWSIDDRIELQHLDASGIKIGTAVTLDVWGDRVNELVVVPDAAGYLVGVTMERDQNGSVDSRIDLHRFNANPTHQQKLAEVESRPDGILSGLAMAVDAQTAWVTYSRETALEEYEIIVASIDSGSGATTNGPTRITNVALWNRGAPAIAVVGQTPTVAWWNANSEQINGARVSGESVTNRFHIPTGQTDRDDNEPFAMLAHDGKTHLVYPNYVGTDTTELRYLAVGPNETGAVTGGTALTGGKVRHRDPAVVTVDRSDDGDVDNLLVAWERDGSGIAAGRVPLGSPASMMPRSVNGSNFSHSPRIAEAERKAATVWNGIPIKTANNQIVYHVPLSIDGIPVCTDEDE